MPSLPKVFTGLLVLLSLTACGSMRGSRAPYREPDPDNVLQIGSGAPQAPAYPGVASSPAAVASPVRSTPSAAPSAPARYAEAPASAPRPAESVNTYRLRPRDFIRVLVINENDTQIERRINSDGTIDVPFLKQIVPVAGLTLTQAQDEIAQRFRKYFKDPQVVISIVSYAERRVYVSGYVGKPGPVSIPPEENLTLGRALSMAGGILPRGRRTDVAVKRFRNGAMEVISKNMRKIDSGDEPDFVLEDEDQIYVDDSRI
jgi:protein involved in polysaccharide export with SLBB domain